MKKSLLLCSLALAAACNLFAQDTTAKPGTLKNPLPLNIGGENKYEYAGAIQHLYGNTPLPRIRW